MKMHLFYLALLSIILTESCNTMTANNPVDNKRKAILDFQLGMSDRKVDSLHAKYLQDGKFKNFKGQFAYMENPINNGHIYYSGLKVLHNTGDTIVAEISIYFTDFLDENFRIYIGGDRSNSRVFTYVHPESGITDKDIVNDVINKVSSTYGNFDESDTLKINSDTDISYMWKNRNDVDITLKYSFYSQYDYSLGLNVQNYIIQLNYLYTKQMKESLKTNKSIY